MTGTDTLRRSLIAGVILIFFLTIAPRAQPKGETTQDTFSAARLRRPSDSWVPADIDQYVPATNGQQTCSLADVLAGAGRQVQKLVTNLDRYTATEIIEHQNVDRSGKIGKVQSRTSNYAIHMFLGTSGYMALEELRDPAGDNFPDRTATSGTPSLMLVFHPLYAQDFKMECEGLGTWHGQPAWQVRFEQRDDRPVHLSALAVGNRTFPVRLRGRAWILADSCQLARIETDLARTIPEIGMRLEHIVVDYGPVWFSARTTQLWLPLNAELYVDFKGHRFYRNLSFAHFTLFSVDVEQRFAIAAGESAEASGAE